MTSNITSRIAGVALLALGVLPMAALAAAAHAQTIQHLNSPQAVAQSQPGQASQTFAAR